MATNSENAIDLANLAWRKSIHSNPSGNCLEIAELPDGGIALRNGRYPAAFITATRGERDAFLAGAKDGEFDAV
ncbi:DUF397 domain-containing protein [Nocardia sp. NPDC059246]|uniref:DUF397 domain-containing protein n=1 Tax=unclassified Nocardia TaxID=2637762 RepID=UPI0036CA73A7